MLLGAFTPDLNPDAPEVVLPGFGPEIEGAAGHFAQQREPIPVFLKHRSNAWRYMGDYYCRELSRDPAIIAKRAARAVRLGQVSMVLFLEAVNGTSPTVKPEAATPRARQPMLRDRGIWLLDASLAALYRPGGKKHSRNTIEHGSGRAGSYTSAAASKRLHQKRSSASASVSRRF